MILYSILVYILLFTQAHIPVCLDGTIIDSSSSTILATMYLKKNQTTPRPSEHPPVMGEKLGHDWWLCMAINISVRYSGGLLPDIILLTQGYY